jgi:hypothetical protein
LAVKSGVPNSRKRMLGSDDEPAQTTKQNSRKSKFNRYLRYCDICFKDFRAPVQYNRHMSIHKEKTNRVLDLILTNGIKIANKYSKYLNKDKFIIIQKILKRLKNESAILLNNYNFVKNANVNFFL